MEAGAPASTGSVASVSASPAPVTIDAGSSAASTPAAPEAAAPAPETAPAEAAATAPAAEAPTPWYLGPWVMVGAVLLILGGLVLLMRRRKPTPAENGNGGTRLSDDEALRASIAKTREAGVRIAPVAAPAPVIVPAGKVAATAAATAAEGELALKALKDAVRQRPKDLEAHLSLLRFYHSRGDAEAYQEAAQAMRAQLPTTMDPRWREAVVMGASLMPKTQMFSQAGWNSPRFDDSGAPAATPAAAAAPAAVPAAAAVAAAAMPAPATARPAAPVAAAKPAPVRVFEPPVEEDSLPVVTEVDDPNLFGDFDGGALHRNEAQMQVEDEASATRIELAKAYLAIGDLDGARSMLEEVLAEGGPTARSEAARILKEIG
jgi:pilus assembly protein FimV